MNRQTSQPGAGYDACASHHHFFCRSQFDIRVVAPDTVNIPLQPRQEHGVAVVIRRDVLLVGGREFFDGVLAASDPTGRCKLRGFETDGQAVLQFDSTGENFELQRTDDASATRT